MVTELDLTAIKQKIVDIIKADQTLFNETNAAGDKFRTVDIGVPDEQDFYSIPTPYCRVTNDSDIELVDKPKGGMVNDIVSVSEHIGNFLILVVSQEDNAREIEIHLDTIHKKLKEVLKANQNLGGLVKTSHPVSTKYLLSGTFKGKSVDGFVIKLQYIAYTS